MIQLLLLSVIVALSTTTAFGVFDSFYGKSVFFAAEKVATPPSPAVITPPSPTSSPTLQHPIKPKETIRTIITAEEGRDPERLVRPESIVVYAKTPSTPTTTTANKKLLKKALQLNHVVKKSTPVAQNSKKTANAQPDQVVAQIPAWAKLKPEPKNKQFNDTTNRFNSLRCTE